MGVEEAATDETDLPGILVATMIETETGTAETIGKTTAEMLVDDPRHLEPPLRLLRPPCQHALAPINPLLKPRLAVVAVLRPVASRETEPP